VKPKILIVGWGFPPKIDGGLDIHVHHLFKELEKQELDVSLALPAERAPERPKIISLETGEGDMVERSRRMSQKVAEIAGDFDIIHTHDWFGAEAGFKSKKYSDVKWVSTVHSLAGGRTRKPDERLEKLEKVAIEQSDLSITVSRKLQKEISEKYGKEPEIVYNGFSKPASSGIDIKKRYGIEDEMFFYVGRHAEQKGLEHLIYGFRKVLEERENAKLVLGGEGHLTGSLKKFVEILGIQNNVVFTGFIPREELGDYYSAADVFVSPSVNEPFGLTITEALESNTPVVATKNGVEEITDSGIVSVRPNSDSIKKGVLEALKNGSVENLESRGWEEMTEELLNYYNSL